MEHRAGVRCPECPTIVTIRVDVRQEPSPAGPYETVELDMGEWIGHTRTHQPAR